MESTERYQKAMHTIDQLYGASGQGIVAMFNDLSPVFGEWFVNFAFGDVYSRPQLDLKQRQLIAIASLTTQGDCELQLSVQINNALNVGLLAEEIVEAIMHCVVFIGFPRVVNALRIAKRIFVERGVS